MAAITLTKKIVVAICSDAHAAVIRKGGDEDAAADAFNSQMKRLVPTPEAWIDMAAE